MRNAALIHISSAMTAVLVNMTFEHSNCGTAESDSESGSSKLANGHVDP